MLLIDLSLKNQVITYASIELAVRRMSASGFRNCSLDE